MGELLILFLVIFGLAIVLSVFLIVAKTTKTINILLFLVFVLTACVGLMNYSSFPTNYIAFKIVAIVLVLCGLYPLYLKMIKKEDVKLVKKISVGVLVLNLIYLLF